jgi:hypothetical protein
MQNHNVITKNFLTDKEIEEIYAAKEDAYKEFIMRDFGQQVSDFLMSEETKDKIIKKCEEIFEVSGLKLMAYQFARYEKFIRKNGTVSNPLLFPHVDGFDEKRFTFDLQLRSNTDWSIFVEGKEFILKDNEALTFYGTLQEHWRPEKDFQDGEYIDMLFCHLEL